MIARIDIGASDTDARLEQRFGGHPDVEIERGIESEDAFFEADVMISDQSGAALEYALGFGRGLDWDKADQFVGMYVNDWTLDFGERGRRRILGGHRNGQRMVGGHGAETGAENRIVPRGIDFQAGSLDAGRHLVEGEIQVKAL